MEVTGLLRKRFCPLLLTGLLCAFGAAAQPQQVYAVKNGKMIVQLPKTISPASLDSFIARFDLADLGLKTFLKTARADSLLKLGWRIEANNETGVVISKPVAPLEGLKELDNELFFKKRDPLFPSVNNGIVLGVNRFRNKGSFYRGDSSVRFFLRGRTGARQVRLAGSFNRWIPTQLSMQRTDSGWIYDTKLGPGKWWYKFIVDDEWTVDRDNLLSENDGRGNINSVFFRPNVSFLLTGYPNAGKVFLAGSFNDWKPADLAMQRTPAGWALPLYLAQGTYTYKFVVDGKWLADEKNPEKAPDGYEGFNSVLRLGKPYLFRLNGFQNRREVKLAGSFNQWRDFEWPLIKTPTGWELPYTLGPGNYQYKFKVDGKWISDPANPFSSPATGASHLVVEPNYTFRIKAFPQAKAVYLAGEFNNWDSKAWALRREGDEWIFSVHLSVGKHLYKVVVDDVWQIDPTNKLWEQNEYGTGNSVLWFEQ